jgi:hypothetical protein
MSVSRETVKRLVDILLEADNELTTEELRKLSGFSLSTVRQAINGAQLQGSIYKVSGSWPTKFKASKDMPKPGETIVIKEPLRLSQASPETTRNIRARLASDPEKLGIQVTDQLVKYYLSNTAEDKRKNLKEFLIGFAEVIDQDLEYNAVLDPSDIKVKK